MTTVAVVGGGLAGLRAVQSLREQGFGGRLVVVSEETEPPYDRTLLSKSLLAGTAAPGEEYFLDAGGLAELKAEWHPGRRAVQLRTAPLCIVLDDGEVLTAGGVVIATGSRARALPALTGAHVLRTRADCERLRAALAVPSRVTVVGAGLVGGEVTATAVALGHVVTVVEAAPDPFVRQFGALCAARLVALHESHGVRIIPGTTVERLAPAGRGGAALLSTGELVPTDVVVVGIGAVPNVEWLAGSGIDVDDGVVTDGAGRTSVAGVVAAGDVARYASPTYGPIRVEHWTNARDMPPVAVGALLDQLEDGSQGTVLGYDPVPYFWSTQHGRHLQLAGRPGTGDAMEFVDGDAGADRFAARETLGGRPVAAIGWDSPRAFGRLRRELRDTRGWDAHLSGPAR